MNICAGEIKWVFHEFIQHQIIHAIDFPIQLPWAWLAHCNQSLEWGILVLFEVEQSLAWRVEGKGRWRFGLIWLVIGRQDSMKPWLRSPGIQWGKCGKTWPRATGVRGPGGCQFTEHQAPKGFALGKSWAENYWLLTLEGSNFVSVLINNQIVLKSFKAIWNFLIIGEIDRVT